MKSFWPESFAELEVTTPIEIVEQQLKFLPTLTGDKVYGELKDTVSHTRLFSEFSKHDFSFSIVLKGKFLKNYSFELFAIAYPITIYPVEINLDEELTRGLGLPKGLIKLDNKEDFMQILESIFKSDRTKTVIGAIMKLS